MILGNVRCQGVPGQQLSISLQSPSDPDKGAWHPRVSREGWHHSRETDEAATIAWSTGLVIGPCP